MSAQPGEPTPNAFVFPPFAPPVFRPAAPSSASGSRDAAPDEPVAAAPDEFGMEVPLPAHDLGDPGDDAEAPAASFTGSDDEAMPWDAAPASEAPAAHNAGDFSVDGTTSFSDESADALFADQTAASFVDESPFAGEAESPPFTDQTESPSFAEAAPSVEDAPSTEAAPFADNAAFVDDAPSTEAAPFVDDASSADAVPSAEAAAFGDDAHDSAPRIADDAQPANDTSDAAHFASDAVPFVENAQPAPTADDLPWLELPAGAPRVHPADVPAVEEALPDWMALDVDGGESTAPAQPSDEPRASTAEFDIADLAPDAPETDAAEVSAYAPEESAGDDDMPWLDTAAIRAPDPEEMTVEAELPAREPNAEAAPQPFDEPLPEYAASLGHDEAPYADAPAAQFVSQPSEASATPEPGAHDAAFGEVADRLEGIARALRDDPRAFLAGAGSDPLGLLVTGFVLGYGQRG